MVDDLASMQFMFVEKGSKHRLPEDFVSLQSVECFIKTDDPTPTVQTAKRFDAAGSVRKNEIYYDLWGQDLVFIEVPFEIDQVQVIYHSSLP
jgi:hypothetical protein